MIDKNVSQPDTEKSLAQNNEKAVFGINSKILLKQVKKFKLAGELVQVVNTHELGIDLLTEIRTHKNELGAAANENILKKKQKQLDTINDYRRLVINKPNSNT